MTPLSSILHKTCETCGKVAVEKSCVKLGSTKIITLVCGHILAESGLESSRYDSIISSDGCKPRPYQIAGIQFLERSNARALLADEQGLGKMIQTAGLLKLHPELMPAVFCTKTTVKTQTAHELVRWGVTDLVQVIQSSKEKAFPGFNVYVTTYDLTKNEDMFSDVNIKTIIVDECQAIKNHLSERAKAVQRLARTVEHVIGLSGTPIKNNAGEYFTILNLLDPRRFPTYQGYLDEFCDSYWSGYGNKVGGLRRPERFHEITADIILRRTKAEVLPELPSLSRLFQHVELDRKLNKAYAKALDELDELYYAEDTNEMERSSNMLAVMSKLRKITGISKVEQAVDFTTEFLMSCERKIVIFTHHIDVMTLLEANLGKWCEDGGFVKPLLLHSGLDGNGRAALVERFKTSDARIMIASTLAAGEGLNLQFCSDAIMLERQWNPANEEQGEGRFHRFGQVNPVSVTYMIAAGTIDDYFTELVEQKRAIVASALDNKTIEWNQSSLMQELATALVTRGREKWRL